MTRSSDENRVSELWLRTFLTTVDPARTAAEVAFLRRQLPASIISTILDLCCGKGRHAGALARSGYEVTGVDRDSAVLESARSEAAGPTYLQMDVRCVRDLDRQWDAVILMWASFGYLCAAENAALLTDIRSVLTPRGRLVLDVYNRDFFETRLGVRRVHRGGQEVVERTSMAHGRLNVELQYVGHDVVDRFSWQIHRPQELVAAAEAAGFRPEVLCAEFSEQVQPAPERARMQLVASARPL